MQLFDTWSCRHPGRKDGNLDKTEAAPIPTLEVVFETADTNADGSLTGEEYKKYLAMSGDGKAKPKK